MMEHGEEASTIPNREGEAQSAKRDKAETDTVLEYFERYEKNRKSDENTEQKLEYWLSEEEEESHQLRRRTRKSRQKKEPYVARDAKGPKLRPAEGEPVSGVFKQ
jgi:hypothetical protein